MLRLASWVFSSCLLAGVHCLLEFVNPSNGGTEGDLTNMDEYETGKVLDIMWTGWAQGRNPVSIILWQADPQTGRKLEKENDDMEYIIQNSVHPAQKFTWLVGSRKNLATSNVFFMAIFSEGTSGWDSESRYFNITARNVVVTSTSSLSLSSSSTAATSLSSRVSRSDTASEPTGSNLSFIGSSMPNSSSDSFPTSAKIGLGVGIPVALLLGAAAGFFLFRRHKKRHTSPASGTAQITLPHAYPASELASPQKGPVEAYQAPRQHEAGPRSPVEM